MTKSDVNDGRTPLCAELPLLPVTLAESIIPGQGLTEGDIKVDNRRVKVTFRPEGDVKLDVKRDKTGLFAGTTSLKQG